VRIWWRSSGGRGKLGSMGLGSSGGLALGGMSLVF